MRFALLLLLVTATTARAEHDIAFATNAPIGWAFGNVGASGYLALTEEHALRVNAATYAHGPGIAAVFAEDAPIYRGRVSDGGVSYVLFPEGFCKGFMVELGVLVRKRDSVVEDDFGAGITDTDTNSVAGRMMVGWNWTIGEQLFIQLAAGISGGVERGTETIAPDVVFPDRMRETRDVDRQTLDGEVILRFGARFDR